MHALIHSVCFERLIAGLDLRRPGDRLHLPRFDVAGGDRGTPDREAPDLSDPDLAAIGRALERWRRGLRAGGGRVFALSVDGLEVACWKRGDRASVEVDLARDPELVEVWAVEDGERWPVAVSLLAPHPAGGPWEGEALDLALGTGARVAVDVVPAPRPGEPGRCRLRAACTPGLVPRLASRLIGGARFAGHRRAAWATALALVLVAGLALYLGRPGSPPAPAPAGPRSDAGAPTRSANGPWQPVPLAEIRSVFVDSLGDSPGAVRLREALGRRLASSGRFALGERRQDADALLLAARSDSGEVTLRLLNAAGQELWSFASGDPDPEALAERAVADLVDRARSR